MAAFKEGDWVRMTENDYNDGYKSGDVFRLIGVSENGVRFTDTYGDARYADHDSGRFEPWTPKVGERVRMTRAVDSHKAECGATVVEDDGTMTMRFLIEFDERYSWAHEGGGSAKENHGWWVDAADLEPLPVAAEAQPAAPVVEPLTIRAGCYYKTRDGRKVGPIIVAQRFEDPWPWKAVSGRTTYYFKHDGYSCPGTASEHRDKDDIIAEWPADTTTTNVAATVDALDEEYGPVVAVADRDNDTVCFTVSLDTSELHEELDAVISKLKKIRKLQRELGLIAA